MCANALNRFLQHGILWICKTAIAQSASIEPVTHHFFQRGIISIHKIEEIRYNLREGACETETKVYQAVKLLNIMV